MEGTLTKNTMSTHDYIPTDFMRWLKSTFNEGWVHDTWSVLSIARATGITQYRVRQEFERRSFPSKKPDNLNGNLSEMLSHLLALHLQEERVSPAEVARECGLAYTPSRGLLLTYRRRVLTMERLLKAVSRVCEAKANRGFDH